MRGQPGNMRIGKIDDSDTGQIIAYTIHGTYGRPRTIWMDDRPHPSEYAAHSWAGFSTGKWEGNALVVTTTHIKMGWIMRNGVPTSDRATMTERFIRHGDHLLDAIIVNDPVYLSEPFIRTQDWRLNLTGEPNAWGPCSPAQIADEIPIKRRDTFPTTCPAPIPICEISRQARRAAGSGSGRRRNDVPGICGEASRTANRLAAGLCRSKPAVAREVEKAGDIEVLPVQGNIYMIAGAGGNIAVQVGRRRRVDRRCRSRTVERQSVGRDPTAFRQADPFHCQYECQGGPYGRQRAIREGRQQDGWRTPCRRLRRRRRDGHRSRGGLEVDERSVREKSTTRRGRRMLIRASRKRSMRMVKASKFIHLDRRTPMATASFIFGGPTSWSPATSFQ